MQMLVVTIDWELYDRTGSALALGFVGLSLMLPMILCTLPAGHVADSFDRQKIILVTTLVLGAASLGLACVSAFKAPVTWIYLLLALVGASRTFLWPASAAYVTSLVPRKQFSQAVTLNNGAFQFSAAIGPATSGLLIWLLHDAWIIYTINAVASLVCCILVATIRRQHKITSREPMSWKNRVTEFRFVFANKIILGTITLDMFAVLLGRAVSLQPIFSRDILHSGPNGLGVMRAAMPIGALLCALIIHR
jgi:MFS family permease